MMNDYSVKIQNKCFAKIHAKMAQVNNRACNKVTFGEKLRIFPISDIKTLKKGTNIN